MSTTIDTSGKHAKHLPGEAGIWLFIFGDMLVFSLFFIVFVYSRSQNVPLYLESQGQLSQFFGAFNTFFMLSSSWFVAMAIHASRRNMGKETPMLFLMDVVCAVGFLINKVFE